MRFRLLLLATAALAAACTIPASEPSSPAPSPARGRSGLGATESRIFDLINAERRRQGLRVLAYNPELDRMAKIQAQNMAHFQKMAHVLPESSLPTLRDRARYVGYPFGRLAENVAFGFPNPETAVDGWMRSKGHRTNILDGDVEETGIGIVRSPGGGLYYCQVFGRHLRSL